MTTRLTHRLTYSAPLEAVAAMLRDPAFREHVCDAQHALRRTISVDLQGAATVVRVDRTEEARRLPSIATKIVGHEIEIVHTETWHDHERADYAVTIPGKPGHIAGTAVLTESGGVTTETVDLEIRVGIPLVGGKLEALVHDLLVKALVIENRVGADHLAGS